MIRISQLNIPVNHTIKELEIAILKKLKTPGLKFNKCVLVKKSIDARNKKNITLNYIVDVDVDNEEQVLNNCRNNKNISLANPKTYILPHKGEKPLNGPIYVVGSGPAGLFATYFLAEYGYKPILIERGEPVDFRINTVKKYWNGDESLNPESNIQFGEGGAGTFSDGKLNTGVNDPNGRNKLVLETFVKNGAPEEILYSNKPHLGTDVLVNVIKNMRNHIIDCGGQVKFRTRLSDINTLHGNLTHLILNSNNFLTTVECSNLILAIGHSSRDTLETLYKKDLEMQAKAFAIGVRVEHLQENINTAQYGIDYKERYGALLPPADYHLATKTLDGRNVYSFCMCPGGYVVNSSSEKEHLCVNGMSYSDRSGENANSAIIVNITPEDYSSDQSPLDGIKFQRELERVAYTVGGGKIPIQLFKDFRDNISSTELGKVTPQTKGDVVFANINDILPDAICQDICEAMNTFGTTIKGFDDPDTILSAVESRTSSPVRIVRDEHFESNIKGVFPCGEGAGYAGGITSAAIDGIKVFEEIYKRYKAQ